MSFFSLKSKSGVKVVKFMEHNAKNDSEVKEETCLDLLSAISQANLKVFVAFFP